MTYNRVATPRMYMDRLSFDLTNGFRTMSNYTIIQNDGSTAVTFDGGQIEDLFDIYGIYVEEAINYGQALMSLYNSIDVSSVARLATDGEDLDLMGISLLRILENQCLATRYSLGGIDFYLINDLENLLYYDDHHSCRQADIDISDEDDIAECLCE